MRDTTFFDDENEIVSKPVTSLWKRCSSALCAAAHSVKDTTKALLGDWKRNAALACTCVAVMGVLVGTAPKANAETGVNLADQWEEYLFGVPPWPSVQPGPDSAIVFGKASITRSVDPTCTTLGNDICNYSCTASASAILPIAQKTAERYFAATTNTFRSDLGLDSYSCLPPTLGSPQPDGSFFLTRACLVPASTGNCQLNLTLYRTPYPPMPPAVPAPPTGITATPWDGEAMVVFGPSPWSGSPITKYTLTSNPPGITQTLLPDSPFEGGQTIVKGLINGVDYTFTVVATNETGTGPEGISNSVVPFVSDNPADLWENYIFGVPPWSGGGQTLPYYPTNFGKAATTRSEDPTCTALSNGICIYSCTASASAILPKAQATARRNFAAYTNTFRTDLGLDSYSCLPPALGTPDANGNTYVTRACLVPEPTGNCQLRVALYLVFAPTHITADPKNSGKPDCPRAVEGNPINAATEGNSINAATGNKLQIETDYVGSEITGLKIARAYNSQDTASSPFGANWTSTWHRGITQPDANTVKVMREDGRVDTFTNNGGVWTADPDVTSRLSAVANGWQLTRDDDSKELYTTDGRLSSITTRAGLVTTLAYDGSNRLAKVTGPFAHTLTFAYDASNRISTITLPDGKTLGYGYDANNNLSAVTLPNTATRQYHYENASYPHALTGINDESGQRFATFDYADDGRAISSEHAGGVDRVVLSYEDAKTTVIDPRGNTHGYDLTTQFNLVKPTAMTQNCCGGASYAYDASGFLASRTDFNGSVTTYTHNARGLETSRTEAKGTPQERTISTEWHATYHLPTKITEPGRVTALTYDTKGNLTKKTVTAGTVVRSWTYTYNTKGQPLTINGPRTDVNDVTSFAYGTDGNLSKITDALSHITQITSYNANGLPLRVVDPNGLVTTYSYNALNRLETQTVGTETTRYAYTAWGDVSLITLPDGSFVAYDYDAAHRLTGIRDISDNRIVYTLDEAGNRVKEEVFDASGELARTQSRVYDNLNHVVQIIGAQGQTTTFTRDPNNNVTGVTDPLSNTTTNDYDALDRLVKQTDPLGGVVNFAYTAQDAIASVTDPRGLKTTYTRNGFGEETTVASPDTGSTVKTYDAAGNVISWTNAKAQKTTQTYDVLNRPVKTTYADGKSVTRQYDVGTYGIGHVTMITDSTGSTSFQYDQHGREIVRQQKIGTITLTTRRSYDASGRPSSITYPSGRKVTMLYDVNTKQLAGMQVDGKTLLQNIAHAPFGPMTYWETGTGPWQYRVFDQDGLLQGINTQADELWFGRDPAGRVTEFYDTLFNWKGLTYDNGSRLVEETSETSWRGYDYDINGNRTRYGVVDNNGEVSYDYTYAAAQNWLTSRIGSTVKTITHDKTGNITSDGTRTFAYGANGFLLTATNAGVTTTYATNGLAQRVKKSNASGTTLFVTDDNGQLLGEYTAAGTAVQETVWLAGQPVGVIKGTTLYTVNTDQLGAPRTIQNPSGQVVWQWNHDGFGNGAPNEKPGAAASFIYNLRFSGQVYHAETGLYHNNYRDYDPTTGQYLESDPIGLDGGINTFVYVANDPVNKVDPWGLQAAPQMYMPGSPLYTPIPGTPKIPMNLTGPEVFNILTGPDVFNTISLMNNFLMNNFGTFAQLLLQLADQKRANERSSSDPGNCTPDQKTRYQERMHNICDSAFGCEKGDAADILNKKFGQHVDCIDARQMIQDICFPDRPEQGHQEAIDARFAAIKNCQDYLRKLGR